MNPEFFIILTGGLLDLALGDPQIKWHPVRIIGALAGAYERKFNTLSYSRSFYGFMLAFLFPLLVTAGVWLIIRISAMIDSRLSWFISVIFIYFALSARNLTDEALKIKKALVQGDIKLARKKLSMIVGRDTENLNEQEIIRATVETVAESTMDGIIAPFLFLFLGGPAWGWFYKTVNTLDSMVGHKNERFLEFGKASAKLDGWLNWLPSKITAFLISFSMIFIKKDWRGSLKWSWEYLFRGCAENSDTTEAAMAAGLGIRLGGTNYYQSVRVDKPFLGDKSETLNYGHIRQSAGISILACIWMLVFGFIIF